MQKSTALSLDGVRRHSIAQAILIAGFAGLTALGAQLEIPTQPVPFTLQTFFVLLSGAILGGRAAAASQCVYLLAGCAGLPVFAGWGCGVVRLLGPTGGYLLSFPVAAFVVGYLLEGRRGLAWSFISMAVGSVIIFSLGTMVLYFTYLPDWREAFTGGFVVFSWWDLLKVAAAAGIARRFSPRAHHP
jgi:biotin transport system substrate-specific component